ncbi:MAG: TatD family hydrolase, partial [Bacteroidaceae bacterium]
MFIDTHAHIYEEQFNQDLDQTIERAIAAGARKILLPPTDEVSTLKAVALAERYPDICYPMIGLHPEDVSPDYAHALNRLEDMLKNDINSPNPRFVAIGEVGLDYYWDKTHKEEQQQAFTTQIEWAATHNLPLMIHSRSANGDLLKCLKPWRDKLNRGGVFHCFSGSVEEAHELLRFHPGFYLGIGGIITFKKST